MSDGTPREEGMPSFERVEDYKSLYSDIVRTRIGNGDLTLIFSKMIHVPGMNVGGSVVQEQAEVTVTWTYMKILASTLNALTQAVESEIGPIPMPATFFEAEATQLTRQQGAVRTLGLAMSAPPKAADATEVPPRRSRARRKSPDVN